MGLKTFLQKIPFWLKFAIIFTILLSVGVVIAQLIYEMMEPLILYIAAFPLYWLLNKLLHGKDMISWLFVLTPVFYFIIGSIIGFIVHLIKPRIRKH